jgi:hypothetical protein
VQQSAAVKDQALLVTSRPSGEGKVDAIFVARSTPDGAGGVRLPRSAAHGSSRPRLIEDAARVSEEGLIGAVSSTRRLVRSNSVAPWRDWR